MIGVPASPHGEAVKAYVVLPGVDVDEDALIEHCTAYLARYKCPSKVIFVDQLPRNASGKALVRRELEGTVIAGWRTPSSARWANEAQRRPSRRPAFAKKVKSCMRVAMIPSAAIPVATVARLPVYLQLLSRGRASV